ncbi:MAG: mercuric reductase [Cyanobacteria bacterium J06641_5]
MAVEFDLVIIGGGSGGLVVASASAQLGAKVALVEKHRLGGDCLWYGCVPSKSLLHAGRVAQEVRTGSRFGVYADEPRINFSEAIGHVQGVIKHIEPHDSPERFRGLGVDVIFGEGQFTDRKTFVVNGRELKARNFVISTGSRPAIPPIPGLKEVGFITNEQVFSLEERPASLAVLGGGAIGCELGQALSRLGAEVTLVVRSNIMSKEEPEAAAVVEQKLIEEGITILKNTSIVSVERDGELKRLTTNDGKEILVEEILLAAGRSPNVGGLNLEAAGVEYDTKKGVKVNEKLQTTNPQIFACGDIIGGYQFTHVAGYEAVVVLTNALFKSIIPGGLFMDKADYRVIPWATFTEPELARVGMTEAQARARYGDDIYILKQDFNDVDRAQAEGATEGFAKIITDPKGQILGAHMVGPHAGEIIHEIVLAMKNKLPVKSLTLSAGMIHIYPTLAEMNMKVSLQLSKQTYTESTKGKLAKFFNFRRSIAG